MYLKRLETVGFKSFAERIEVDFVPGVTAIVGPNGSGKSNITDAVRWVLGEQSARSLRGSKMEDIIFQGSDSRSPLNVAEVTLVLQNEDRALPLDYEEVSVTRRVYRSGDSEFYINKQACRLKDIIDLFMDSGLGREAFSIISQGKVEEILSSKPEERRTIFEEAAGVLKYKQRKNKAEYKLAETQENLHRVDDIIHEVEQQLSPLKEQAETAKRYLELKEELKQEEISYLITEIEHLHGKWQTVGKQLEEGQTKEMAMQTSIHKKEALITEKKQHVAELDDQVEHQQQKLLEVTQQLENYEGKRSLLNERTKHFDENKQKLENQQADVQEKIAEIEKEYIQAEQRQLELKKERKQTKDQLVEIEKIVHTDKDTVTDQIEDLKADYIEYLNRQAAKRNEKQSIAAQLEQMNNKNNQQEEKLKRSIYDRKRLQTNQEQLVKKMDQQRLVYTDQQAQIEKRKKEINQLQQQLETEQAKLYQGYQYIEKLKSQKEMLEEMKAEFQGFFLGVKSVLKANKSGLLSGIHGAIIELIDVPKEYVTAIETALGGQSQHIVTKDETSARKAISWLKQNNKGRATFLPLSSIQERFIPKSKIQQFENYAGYVGIASQLVKTDSAFQVAINHLIGHVIVTDTLEAANEIARLSGKRYRVVTLEGDVVNPGGSMSGGAKKKTNQSSLFTREKDLQEIKEKLASFMEKTKRFEHKLKEKRAQVDSNKKALEQEEAEFSLIQQELQKLDSEFKEGKVKLSALNDHLSIYDQDKRQFDEDRERLTQKNEQLINDLNKLAEQLTFVQEKIDELTKQERILTENKEKRQAEFHQLQILLAEQEERVKNSRANTRKLEEELAGLKEQYSTLSSELNMMNEIEAQETEEQIEEKIHHYSHEKNALSESIQKKRSKRLEMSTYVEDEERELKEMNKQLQQLAEKLKQKEVQANRLDVELENMLNHLQTEYIITYERAKQLYPKTSNSKQSSAIVQELKNQIERLGTVNLGAIEEYDRLTERYSFLTEQRNDLTEAKKTLYHVIAEMDEEMVSRFETTFKQIKKEFEIVFKQLFGGGHAELKLTDPSNLLETGVDIIAEPPGKKLQHLGLLSGGERALTAIALLFAILRVRPVPFCILDEVEAALDEANVVRFAKYIKMHSKDTQFIVITHRKGTMEEADVLYGVTMQESGVSRLVSVRLEDTKELMNT
jgi:chromosome segregation protein